MARSAVVCVRALALLLLLSTHAHSNAPAPTPDSQGRIPFDVYFDTTAPLGLRLGPTLSVEGFSRAAGGSPSPAEAAEWIEVGDSLVAVNGVDVSKLGPQKTALAIRDAALPKVLTFVPRKPGERRSLKMERKLEEAVDMAPYSGVLEIAAVGTSEATEGSLFPTSSARVSMSAGGRQHHHRRVLVWRIPVLKAHFGSLTSCHPVRVVMSDPPNACGGFRNEHHISNSILLADRGGCQFTDKAVNAQVADGAALVVLNDDGEAIRMPMSDQESTTINIPSVMTSKANSALLHGIVKGAEASGFVDLLGRIVMYNQVCHNSFYPPPAEEESANAQENNPNVASEVKRVLLPDGTVLDAEASGTVSVGTFKSFKEVTESGDVVQSRGGNDTSASGFQEALRLEFIPADFGGSLLASLMDGPRQLLLADPITACEALRNREQDVAGSVLVIERGDCTFEDKYDIVKASGAAGALLINTEHTLFPMPGTGRIPTRSLAPEATPDSQNESGDDAIPFVMVQRTAAVELRKLLNTGSLSLGNVILDGNVRRLWDEVDSLLDHKNWPEDVKARRKHYFKRSMEHHPDKPGGNRIRFEMLNFAYRRANHRYDPDNTEFVDDLE